VQALNVDGEVRRPHTTRFSLILIQVTGHSHRSQSIVYAELTTLYLTTLHLRPFHPLKSSNLPLTPYKKNLKCSLFGSLASAVATSSLVHCTPCTLFLLAFSLAICVLSPNTTTTPNTCKPALAISACSYFGASVVRKMFELIRLPAFAANVSAPVRKARLFSPPSLLLCQEWNMAVGTKAPISMRKQAK